MKHTLIKILSILTLLLTIGHTVEIDQKSISFKIGNGEKQMYIAANPQCKYTRIFFNEAKENLENYTVNVLLLPLDHLSKSPAMIDFILLGKTNQERVDRFKKIVLEDSKEYTKLPQYQIFKNKVEIGKILKKEYDVKKSNKQCIDAFLIKLKIKETDINYKYDLSNIAELDQTKKALMKLNAEHSPSIFDQSFEKLDWMDIVQDRKVFFAKCSADN